MSSPQGLDPKEIIYRIGTFFLLVGIGLVAFFVLSEAARQVSFNYLCWGLIVLILGFIFRAQYRKSVTPSGRFSLVRKLMPKSKKEAAKK
jgi:predicted membrane channel-forming protein YqfA (hemolysin III family)